MLIAAILHRGDKLLKPAAGDFVGFLEAEALKVVAHGHYVGHSPCACGGSPAFPPGIGQSLAGLHSAGESRRQVELPSGSPPM